MAPTILIFLIHIVITFTIFTKANTFTLPMIPLDSPRLQIFPQNLKLNSQDHHQFLMNISIAKASSYLTRRESNSSTNSIEATGYRMLSNYYVTELFFGTGVLVSPYVIIDTGDEKTWVQCDLCDPCFELKSGNIKATASFTYKYLSLDDPRCVPRLDFGGKCGYESTYGGIASTRGLMGTDTFLFTNTQTQKPDFFSDLAFGCGLQNKDFNFGANTGPNNLIAGIFGLSPGPQSFLNQLDNVIQGRFSYCLTSWTEPNLGVSTIHFGEGAQLEGPNVKQIAMNAKYSYHLFLRGISVDGKRIPLPSSICALDESQRIINGFFIDSGAPYSVLPQSAYQPLREAMVDYFATFGWSPVTQQVFDLCYTNGLSEGQSYPSVVFHFGDSATGEGEVDWVMGNDNMFVKLDQTQTSGFCMVVVGIPDPGMCLFGAYQQANFRILYDVKNWVLKFEPVICQENRI